MQLPAGTPADWELFSYLRIVQQVEGCSANWGLSVRLGVVELIKEPARCYHRTRIHDIQTLLPIGRPAGPWDATSLLQLKRMFHNALLLDPGPCPWTPDVFWGPQELVLT